ncbi:MAG: NAD-dependent epimerase/dehydratase family protein [Cyanobacteria bacterium P01_D01_bin.105]
MRVFITGATGYVGSAITRRLITAGHQVLGFARSDKSAEKLKAMGAEIHRGDLDDLDSITAGAANVDGVIHTAISLDDFNKLDETFAKDEKAVEAMFSSLAGTGKPFLYISGSGVLADTGTEAADETVATDDKGPVARRAALEKTVLQAQSRNIRTVVIRPGIVYGQGGSGVFHLFAGLAREAGCGRTIGEGKNVCSVVHVEDLADLFLSALEHSPAGTLFNAASGEEPTMLDIATAIGHALKLTDKPTVWPLNEASAALGPLADGLAANKRISAERARKVLGWRPHRVGLIEDIEHGSYPAAFGVAAGREA